MNRKIRYLFLLLLLINTELLAQDGVWQWHADVPGSINKKGKTKAYLWVPPDCDRLQGLVLAQHNMEEISIIESKAFRKAMSELHFGIVWYNPMFNFVFNFEEGAGELLNQSLKALAAKSGYSEITKVPYLAIGHSAAASWPYYLAAWDPGRTICAISVSGQWPYFRDPHWAPDIWGNRTIDYIPCLETMGEYEAAATWSAEGLKERQEHPRVPLSMLACPGEGHFAASPEKIDYIVFYIRKAVHYRMPNGRLPLTPVNPEQTGWLADKWRPDEKTQAPAAPVKTYGGDKTQAFWFFDGEHARTTEAYQARFRHQKAPLLGVKVNGKLVKQRNTHLQVLVPFNPDAKSLKMKLQPVFLDTVPGESPRPALWTGLPAGSPLKHPDDARNIKIEKICGPFNKTNKNELEISFDRTCYQSNEVQFEPAVALKYPGNGVFKAAVQQAHFYIPARLSEGKTQQITFPVIPDVREGTRKIKLKAWSDSGLPVRYFVVSGPARVEGGTLSLTSVPAGAKFPVEVMVAAWQYGRSAEPKIQSAEQVVQSFLIEKSTQIKH